MGQDQIIARLKLMGGAKFQGDMRRATGAVTGFGAAGTRSGRAVTAALRPVSASLGMIAGGARRATGALLGMAASAAKIGALGAATAGVFGAGAIAKAGSSYNKLQDQAFVSFSTLLKSDAKAKQLMARIQTLAADSPILDPASASAGVRTMMAYGISVKDVLPLVKTLGDMSAVSGKNIEEVLPQASLAIGQISSKGRLQAQEMNQLAESVGLSRKAIRKALGLSAKEFEDSFKPGQNISAKVALPAIQKAMEAQSAGAAAKLSKTTSGRLDRLKEVLRKKSGDLTRPMYDAAGKGYLKLTKALNGFDAAAAGKKLGGFFASAGEKAGDLIRTVRRAGPQIRQVKDWLVGLVKPLWAMRGDAFGLLASGAKKARPVIGWLAGQARKLPALLGKGAEKGKALGTEILAGIKPLWPLIVGLWPLIKGFGIGVIGGLIATVKVAWPILKLLFRGLGWFGKNVLQPLGPQLEMVGKILGFVFGPGVVGRAGKLIGGLGGKLGWLGKVMQVVTAPARLWIATVRGATMMAFRFAGRIGKTAGWISQKWPGMFSGGIHGAGRLAGAFARLPGRVAGKIGSIGSKVADVFPKLGKYLFDNSIKLGNAVVDGIVKAIGSAAGAISGAVIGILPEKLQGPVKDALGFAGDAVGFAGVAAKKYVKYTPMGLTYSLGKKVAKRANGGMITHDGETLVGERGPEPVRLPRGSRVVPNGEARGRMMRAPRFPSGFTGAVYLDGRELHRSVVKVDRGAEDLAGRSG